VIDVGSNSVRLVVFDGAARSPAYFYNEKVLCGLGRDLKETGRLHVEGRASALAAIQRFVALAVQMKLTVLSAVATAAVREAEDGPDFVAEVLETTKLPVQIATGQEEAKLSAQGVLLGWPEAEGLVCDIGGSIPISAAPLKSLWRRWRELQNGFIWSVDHGAPFHGLICRVANIRSTFFTNTR